MGSIDTTHWQRRLDAVARETGMVGAVLGILRLDDDGPDEMARAATGVLNANTRRDTTVDSLFQIGSITKTWTATVIMQLVDEGKIGLDQRVLDILPGFRLSTDDLTQNVTIRHLLNHTSGLDGDVFIDTGRGDDSLDKYMSVLENAMQTFPVGASWSYCNTGFSILGRVIEVVTGQVWDEAMRERLFVPLGLTHTVTLPEEALLFDAAAGHLTGLPEPNLTPVWGLDRNCGPAGNITTSVADLLTYARLHLRDGVTADGRRLLSAGSMAAMHAFSTATPKTELTGETWGLGFTRLDWGGAQVFGHDGNTIGQSAFLRVYPAGGLAVALMVNGPGADPLYQTLFGEIFGDLAGVTIQPPFELPDEPADLNISPWIGTYERAEVRIEIIDGPDGPLFRSTGKDKLAAIEGNPVTEYRLIPIREGLYGTYADERKMNLPIRFFQLPTGDRYVHFSSRSTRKTS